MQMTFDEAWAAHLKRQNILPQNQETFRHGWNAALVAAAEHCRNGTDIGMTDAVGGYEDGYWTSGADDYAQAILTLEVEVKT